MAEGGYRGISLSHGDNRFSDKERKLLKQLQPRFPKHFSERVDMNKVSVEVMRPWVAEEVERALGFEDDVVVEYAMGLLEDKDNRFPDPRKIQISLTGFLESAAADFVSKLWKLLLSAQESVGGIPQEFVERKKQELKQARERDANAIRGVRGAQAGGARDARGDATTATTTTSVVGAPAGLPPRPDFAQTPRSHQQPAAGAAPSGGGDDGGGAAGGRRRRGFGPAPDSATFRDKSGNATSRTQDRGWGSRAGAGGSKEPSPLPARPPPPASHEPSSVPRRRDDTPHAQRRGDERSARDRYERHPYGDQPRYDRRDRYHDRGGGSYYEAGRERDRPRAWGERDYGRDRRAVGDRGRDDYDYPARGERSGRRDDYGRRSERDDGYAEDRGRGTGGYTYHERPRAESPPAYRASRSHRDEADDPGRRRDEGRDREGVRAARRDGEAEPRPGRRHRRRRAARSVSRSASRSRSRSPPSRSRSRSRDRTSDSSRGRSRSRSRSVSRSRSRSVSRSRTPEVARRPSSRRDSAMREARRGEGDGRRDHRDDMGDDDGVGHGRGLRRRGKLSPSPRPADTEVAGPMDEEQRQPGNGKANAEARERELRAKLKRKSRWE